MKAPRHLEPKTCYLLSRLEGVPFSLLFMVPILHDLKDPKLWELWYIRSLITEKMQDLYHQPYYGLS